MTAIMIPPIANIGIATGTVETAYEHDLINISPSYGESIRSVGIRSGVGDAGHVTKNKSVPREIAKRFDHGNDPFPAVHIIMPGELKDIR